MDYVVLTAHNAVRLRKKNVRGVTQCTDIQFMIVANGIKKGNEMKSYSKKYICRYMIFTFIIGICFSGCKRDEQLKNTKQYPSESIAQESDSNQTASNLKQDIVDDTEDVLLEEENNSITKEVDYSEYFDGLEGGAVFYDTKQNIYYMYNKDICEEEASPYSTFKIIATLMGLHENIINSTTSTMGYDGEIYAMPTWNANLGLKDAFKASCVWYFRKVINEISKSEVQKQLDNLCFGNCDIIEWEGNKDYGNPQISGFWLDSSLKISPIEWVEVLSKILGGDTIYSTDEINILKEIMLTEENKNIKIYGKTGTGNNNKGYRGHGWFVGFFEGNNESYIFAVHLMDQSDEVSGKKAHEIADDIINNCFIKFREESESFDRK